MTWFFAFVIVALMGVVAVVATGRGGSMAETYDDRPDARVPADGPLTAQDLRQRAVLHGAARLPDVGGRRAARPARGRAGRRGGGRPGGGGPARATGGRVAVRALIRREIVLDVPADTAWDYVTDWPRQGEWVPHTRVEHVDPAHPAVGVGGRLRAWSGLGPVGFWDTMTITSWERQRRRRRPLRGAAHRQGGAGRGRVRGGLRGRATQPVRLVGDGGAAASGRSARSASGWRDRSWSG